MNRVVIFVLLLTMMAGSSLAASVGGWVRDLDTQEPIVNAEVKFGFTDPIIVHTDVNGEYEIAEIAAGTYPVTIKAEHWYFWTTYNGENPEIIISDGLNQQNFEIERSHYYIPVSPTGRPYAIVISSAMVDENILEVGDEVGVFDGDLCVGSAVFGFTSDGEAHDWPNQPQPMTSWEGDPAQGLEGFTAGNTMVFMVYDASTELNLEAVSNYLIGNGEFGFGPFAQVELTATVGPAEISVEPGSFDFGDVPVNSTVNTLLTVRNVGGQPLTVEDANIEEAGFAVQGFAPFDLNPNQETTVTVSFAPTEEITYNGNLIFLSNDVVNPTFSVPLSGNGVAAGAPEIELSTALLEFGQVGVFNSITNALTITNNGGGEDLVINNITFAGDHSEDFSLSGDIAFPLTISWQNTYDLSVTFAPLQQMAYNVTMTISSNAQSMPEAAVVLTGEGIEGTRFYPVAPTDNRYQILVHRVYMNGSVWDFEIGDEIGVFDGNLCVGAGVWSEITDFPWNLETFGESTPGAGDGFVNGNPITFQLWDSGESALYQSPGSFFHSGNGTFGDGVVSEVAIYEGNFPGAIIAIDPMAVDFGTHEVNTTWDESFTIQNLGLEDLVVSNVVIDDNSYSVSPDLTTTTLVPFSDALEATVTFSPAEAGDHNGTITINLESGLPGILTVSGVATPIFAEVEGYVLTADREDPFPHDYEPESGDPVVGASVVINGAEAVLTDDQGYYHAMDILTGIGVDVTITHPDYLDGVFTVDLVPGLQQLDFELVYIDAVRQVPGAMVTEYQLGQNFPNPFNPSTTIRFDLVEPQDVKLTVYNTVGQEIAVLLQGRVDAGRHELTFHAGSIPSGIYFYKIESEAFSDMKKMTLIK